MTNREYLLAILRDRSSNGEKKCAEHFRNLFGCIQISAKDCVKFQDCASCYEHWFESEVNEHGNP